MVRSSFRYIIRSKTTSQSIRKEILKEIVVFEGKNFCLSDKERNICA